MSDFVVQLAPAAEGDIADAILWYRARNALMADAFRAEVFDVIERIGRTPLQKPEDAEGNRRSLLQRFPYSVVYDVLGNTVTILAVTHHRRRPNYWRTARS